MDAIMVEKVQLLATPGQEKYNLLLLEKANKSVKLKQSFPFKHNLPFTKLKVGRKIHTSARLTSYNGSSCYIIPNEEVKSVITTTPRAIAMSEVVLSLDFYCANLCQVLEKYPRLSYVSKREGCCELRTGLHPPNDLLSVRKCRKQPCT